MFSSYFKNAWRHLLRNKVFTLINVAGLGLGMACALFGILFIRDEMSFDGFHRNRSQLYRLTTTVTNTDYVSQTLGTTGQVQGPAFKEVIPDIESYVRILGMNDINLSANNKSLAIKNVYADS